MAGTPKHYITCFHSPTKRKNIHVEEIFKGLPVLNVQFLLERQTFKWIGTHTAYIKINQKIQGYFELAMCIWIFSLAVLVIQAHIVCISYCLYCLLFNCWIQ